MGTWVQVQDPVEREEMDRAFLFRLEALRVWPLDPLDRGKRASLDAAMLGLLLPEEPQQLRIAPEDEQG